MTISTTDLANLEKAYARGVLRVREGETWVEYQSADDLWNAIQRLRSELGVEGKRPSGTRRVSVNKGY